MSLELRDSWRGDVDFPQDGHHRPGSAWVLDEQVEPWGPSLQFLNQMWWLTDHSDLLWELRGSLWGARAILVQGHLVCRFVQTQTGSLSYPTHNQSKIWYSIKHIWVLSSFSNLFHTFKSRTSCSVKVGFLSWDFPLICARCGAVAFAAVSGQEPRD